MNNEEQPQDAKSGPEEPDNVSRETIGGGADSERFLRDAYERMRRQSAGKPYRGAGRRPQRGSAVQPEAPETVDESEEALQPSQWRPGPGIARSKTGAGPSLWDPQPLGAVLGREMRRRAWQSNLSLGTVIMQWPQVVGNAVAQHSTVESFKEGRLQVRADSTAWARQLQLLVPQIEKRLDEVLGAGAVKQVIVHGPRPPSWKHGPRSVPGRGPRDTYG